MKKYITYIFVSFFIIPIYGQEDLWDVIRENSNFQYSADRSEIQKALKIYQNNQYLVDRLSKNGQRYLYHMVDETLKRDMPVELALLPFVESQFDPYAQSPAGASGIWQFILSTAREQGLKEIGGMTVEETLLHQPIQLLIISIQCIKKLMIGCLQLHHLMLVLQESKERLKKIKT